MEKENPKPKTHSPKHDLCKLGLFGEARRLLGRRPTITEQRVVQMVVYMTQPHVLLRRPVLLAREPDRPRPRR